MWYIALKDQEFKTVLLASEKYIVTNKFPPTIADIREEVVKIIHPTPDNGEQKWLEVLEAVKKYGSYNEGQALASLDETTRQAVKTIGYRTICLSEKIGVERAHFFKIYNSIAKKDHDQNIVPQRIVNQIINLQKSTPKQIEE
jgi:hypothetical protein